MQIWLTMTAVLEYAVMTLQLGLSVWSLAIMLDRRKYLRKVRGAAANWSEQVRAGQWESIKSEAHKQESLHAQVLRAVIAVGHENAETVDRAIKGFLTEQRLLLEKGLPVLATLGANAPFIGLFGTVLGIIRAFAALSGDSSGAASVMSGISQALYATAAGLFVAIPAVVAYNYFSNQVRVLVQEGEALKDVYLGRKGKQ